MNANVIYWLGLAVYVGLGLWNNWPLKAGKAKELGGLALQGLLWGLLGWKVLGASLGGP